MTNKKIKYILKLIDLYTVEEESSRGCYSKKIPQENILKLKEDIKELL